MQCPFLIPYKITHPSHITLNNNSFEAFPWPRRLIYMVLLYMFLLYLAKVLIDRSRETSRIISDMQTHLYHSLEGISLIVLYVWAIELHNRPCLLIQSCEKYKNCVGAVFKSHELYTIFFLHLVLTSPLSMLSCFCYIVCVEIISKTEPN